MSLPVVIAKIGPFLPRLSSFTLLPPEDPAIAQQFCRSGFLLKAGAWSKWFRFLPRNMGSFHRGWTGMRIPYTPATQMGNLNFV